MATNGDIPLRPSESPRPSAASGWVAALPFAIGLIAAGMEPGARVPQPAAPAAEVVAVAAPRAQPVLNVSQNTMVAHYINVGQANSTLLEFECGAVLIDAGAENDDQVIALQTYLEDFFARRQDLQRTLNSIIITHNHVDHTRALREIVTDFRVERLLENGQRGKRPASDQGDRDLIWTVANRATEGRSVTVLDLNDKMVSDVVDRTGFTNAEVDPVACAGVDPQIRVLSADLLEDPGWGDAEFDNKNNHSVVVRVDFGESSFLFTGDLEEHAIETMVDYYDGTEVLDADVYEVGHHGSHNGTTVDLVNAISPDIAVISMGPWNVQEKWTAWAYGHPREHVIEMLRDGISRSRSQPRTVHIAPGAKEFFTTTMTDAIYGTGWDGNIRIQAHADGRQKVFTEL